VQPPVAQSCIDHAISKLNDLHKELEGLHMTILLILNQVLELSNEFIKIKDTMTQVRYIAQPNPESVMMQPSGSIVTQ
jgi:hypothetical protein